MENQNRPPLQVTIKRQYRTDPSDLTFTNYIRFVYSGTDVVMDVGLIDPDRIHALVADPALIPEADAQILKRFGMSLNTFAMLKRNVDEIWNKIDLSKAVDPELTKRGS